MDTVWRESGACNLITWLRTFVYFLFCIVFASFAAQFHICSSIGFRFRARRSLELLQHFRSSNLPILSRVPCPVSHVACVSPTLETGESSPYQGGGLFLKGKRRSRSRSRSISLISLFRGHRRQVSWPTPMFVYLTVHKLDSPERALSIHLTICTSGRAYLDKSALRLLRLSCLDPQIWRSTFCPAGRRRSPPADPVQIPT